MNYRNMQDLIRLAEKQKEKIGEIVIAVEAEQKDMTPEKVREEMVKVWRVMQASIRKGLTEENRSVSGLSGGDAKRVAKAKPHFLSRRTLKAVAMALGVAEVNAAMGKSILNVINPDDVIEAYGADTFRLYEMFMAPLGDARMWDSEGIAGCRRFLERLWRLFVDVESDEPIRAELLEEDFHYFTVQCGAYARRSDALALTRRLAGRGHVTRVERGRSNGRVVYRVRAGRYPTAREANTAARRLRACGVETVVLP